jgi:glycine/D-amino acid oxidase-like deaminating enzyme
MQNYDFIVVGGGFTGAVLAYELVKLGVSVLLIEKDANLDNATRYSYGGLSYWLATSKFTHQTAQKGREYYLNLSQELVTDTEFRELNLLLTIGRDCDSNLILNNYQNFITKPQLLDVKEACELEPLLNPDAIAGALRYTQGHINPLKTMKAFHKNFLYLGGKIYYEEVRELIGENSKVIGVKTKENSYFSPHNIICAGWLTRKLLQQIGVNLKLYYTYEQVIITEPPPLKLQCQIMPAASQRLSLEQEAGKLESEWDKLGNNLLQPIIDTGAIQFRDGHFCLGQVTQVFPNSQAKINLNKCENIIRESIKKVLPSLANLTGNCHSCLVSFTPNSEPIMGVIDGFEGIYTFSGFTSTLLLAPPLARDFASSLSNLD